MHDGGAALRDRITSAVCQALQPLPNVLAGWEGGSVAFNATDEYSDIDLNFLVDDAASLEELYSTSEVAIGSVSPITAVHPEPPGRYYKLQDGSEFFLVDLCFFRSGASDRKLDVERHGQVRRLFDKGEWLESSGAEAVSVEARRRKRLQELEGWFAVSQTFVWKAVHRGQQIEALAAFWGYTLRPLVELLRMRYCPARWDFGMRYLHRDLPGPVYRELRDIMFVQDPAALADHLAKAVEWGENLLQEHGAGRRNPTSGQAGEQPDAADAT